MQISIARPTETGNAIANSMMNPRNWKLPTTILKFGPDAERLRKETAYALDFYLGGHEETREGDLIVLSSKGYYHYVGA